MSKGYRVVRKGASQLASRIRNLETPERLAIATPSACNEFNGLIVISSSVMVPFSSNRRMSTPFSCLSAIEALNSRAMLQPSTETNSRSYRKFVRTSETVNRICPTESAPLKGLNPSGDLRTTSGCNSEETSRRFLAATNLHHLSSEIAIAEGSCVGRSKSKSSVDLIRRRSIGAIDLHPRLTRPESQWAARFLPLLDNMVSLTDHLSCYF